MNKSDFDPIQQQMALSSKVVAGLERVSEVFKILLWEKAKLIGLSPIQIQILLFIAYHKQELSNVSHLAKEFNVTKPTISDAIKVLEKKKLVVKDHSLSDNRSYSLLLSALGSKMVSETYDFASPLKGQIDKINQPDLESLYKTLSQLIYQLNKTGLLAVQRTCFGCRFHEEKNGGSYCKLLVTDLATKDIRIDCPEFEAKGD